MAEEVFAEAGYSGARVDEIAARMSTTKRMIYYYFGSKEDLYVAVLERAYRGIREAERAMDLGDLPPADALRRVAELTFDHHHRHPAFIRLVAIENIHHAKFLKKIGKPCASSAPRQPPCWRRSSSRGRRDGSFAARMSTRSTCT